MMMISGLLWLGLILPASHLYYVKYTLISQESVAELFHISHWWIVLEKYCLQSKHVAFVEQCLFCLLSRCGGPALFIPVYL